MKCAKTEMAIGKIIEGNEKKLDGKEKEAKKL
jgi:hypothetical protein